MAGGGINVYIGASVADLIAGLTQGQTAIRNFGREAQALRPQIDAGTQGFRSLTDVFRDYRREQVQEGRLVGFYVKELIDVTGWSKQAGAAIGGIGQAAMALMSGSLIGAGFEVVKTAVGAIRDLASDARTELDKLKTKFDQIVEAQARAKLSQIDAAYREAMTDPKGDFQKTLDKLRDLGAERDRQVFMLQGTGQLENKIGRDALAYIEARRVALSAELDAIQARNAAVRDEATRGLQGQGAAFWQQGPGPTGKDWNNEVAAAAAEQADVAFNAFVREFQALSKSEERPYLSPAIQVQTNAFIEQRRQADELAKQGRPLYEGGYLPQEVDQERAGGAGGFGAAFKERFAQEQAELKKTQQAWQSYGRAVANTMADLIERHRTMADVMKQALSEMLRAFINYVLQSILAAVGLTGAKVETQWADKGPWGWLIGLGMAAAAMAATAAFGNGIGSAAGGWETPMSGGPFPSILHEGEIVSHRRDSAALKRLDEMAERGELGGMGGGGTHYHFGPGSIVAADARSFEDMMVRNQRGARRAAARIARTRR